MIIGDIFLAASSFAIGAPMPNFLARSAIWKLFRAGWNRLSPGFEDPFDVGGLLTELGGEVLAETPEVGLDGIDIGCENEFLFNVMDAALWKVETIELAESP
jgi:hypothetical protein